MELNRLQWTEADKPRFLSYLETFRQSSKEAWARSILNTTLDVLCVPSKTIDAIIKDIRKGDFLSFLDLMIFDHYEAIVIYGKIMSGITDFDVMTKYLNRYLDTMENWAHVDVLSFQIRKDNQAQFIHLVDHYLLDQRLFVRRLALMILFQMVKDDHVLDTIFDRIKRLKDEKAYYVIMMAGWLLCECLILYPNRTRVFLGSTKDLNARIVNKAIQKCRESRRLSAEEKEQLLVYKRKITKK